MDSIGVAIIGAGAIALANHVPGIELSRRARLVALCDTSPATLDAASRKTGVSLTFTDYHDAVAHPDVDAVIIATPNFVHREIVLAAAARKKHVLCEKPLSLDLAGAVEMLDAVERAGVKHMTAFTYRFVPAMRYMKHLVDTGLVGTPYHFRAQRFQDWGVRALGWRQVRTLSGSGELGDMLSHRIDYGHLLLGRIDRLVADLRQLVNTRGDRPADVDDWVGALCAFTGGATGMLESTKLAAGRGEGLRGRDAVEINGSEGSIVYSTQRPLEIRIGRLGDEDLHVEKVPDAFLVWPGSPRDPRQGDPVQTFRYDQSIEFIDAIVTGRPCRPSFREGVAVQAVMEAIVRSSEQGSWVSLSDLAPYEELFS